MRSLKGSRLRISKGACWRTWRVRASLTKLLARLSPCCCRYSVRSRLNGAPKPPSQRPPSTRWLQVADFDQFKTMMLFYKREKEEEESKHAGEQLVGIRTTGGDVAMLTEVTQNHHTSSRETLRAPSLSFRPGFLRGLYTPYVSLTPPPPPVHTQHTNTQNAQTPPSRWRA